MSRICPQTGEAVLYMDCLECDEKICKGGTNMIFPNRETVKRLQEKYPEGTRVELLVMNDFQAPPIGTKGTVRYVDDAGSIGVDWDNGSTLSIVYGADRCKKI